MKAYNFFLLESFSANACLFLKSISLISLTFFRFNVCKILCFFSSCKVDYLVWAATFHNLLSLSLSLFFSWPPQQKQGDTREREGEKKWSTWASSCFGWKVKGEVVWKAKGSKFAREVVVRQPNRWAWPGSWANGRSLGINVLLL